MSNIVSVNNIFAAPGFISTFIKKHPDYKYIVVTDKNVGTMHDRISDIVDCERVCIRGGINTAIKDYFTNGINVVAGPSFFKGAHFTQTTIRHIKKNKYMLILDHMEPNPYGVGKKIFNIFDNVMVVESRDYNRMNEYMIAKNIEFKKYHIRIRNKYNARK